MKIENLGMTRSLELGRLDTEGELPKFLVNQIN